MDTIKRYSKKKKKKKRKKEKKTPPPKTKLYKGICETTFKKRYANHNKYFNVERNNNDTKLSTEYWKLANKKLQ